MSLSSDVKRRMVIHALPKRIGDPTEEIIPGANLSTSRELLESDPNLIVYVNFQTGDDGTGDGTFGNPYKTYAKGVTEVGAGSETHVEWMTDDPINEQITVPTQVSIGVIAILQSPATVLDPWTAGTPLITNGAPLGLDNDNKSRWICTHARIIPDPPTITYSDDNGATWSNVTTVGFTEVVINEITTDRSGNWVAVAKNGQIAYSNDNGLNFTLATTPSFGSSDIRGVTTDRSGNWVAVSSDGKVAYSTDNGDNWTQGTMPMTSALSVTTDRSGNWVACGGGTSSFAYSTDNGATWTLSTTSGTLTAPFDITTDESGNWVAVGSTGASAPMIAFSTDNGDNWTDANSVLPFTGIDNVSSIATDRAGNWVAGSSTAPKMAYSTDNGDNWTLIATSAIGGPVWSISANDKGGWVERNQGGGSSVSYILNSVINPFADVCGFSTTDKMAPSNPNVKLQQMSIQATDEQGIESSVALNINKCSIISDENHALDITSSVLILTNNFIQTKFTGKNALKLTGAAVNVGDINIEFNDFIALDNTEIAIAIDNNVGGLGNEIMQNNIIEGGVTATEQVNPFTMESGNIRGSADPGVLIASQVSSSDPLFVLATDYRLQRESGYPDTESFAFDSPLVQAGRDHTTATIEHITSTGLVRDYGCFSYDDSLVSDQFTLPKQMDRPKLIKFMAINRSRVYAGVSGDYDIFNDTERRGEKVIMTWEKGLSAEDYAFFDQIENSENTRIFLSLDPTELIAQPSITINGAHPANSVIINIQATQLFVGSSMLLSDNSKQFIMYGMDANNKKAVENVTQLILSEPLREAFTDLQVIPMTLPFGTGEYIYIPNENPGFTRQADFSSEHLKGFSISLIRKKP